MGLPDTSPVPKKDFDGDGLHPGLRRRGQDDGKTVKVSLDKVQRSGVRTEPAKPACSCSRCAPSAPSQSTSAGSTIVTMRSDGYIEDLFVNTTGQHVRAGEPLFRVYSPDIQRRADRPSGRQELVAARRGETSMRKIGRRRDAAAAQSRRAREPHPRSARERRQPAHHRLAGAGRRHGDRQEDHQRSARGRRRRALSHRRSHERLGDRRCRRKRSRRHQARQPRHRDVPRLSAASRSKAR